MSLRPESPPADTVRPLPLETLRLRADSEAGACAEEPGLLVCDRIRTRSNSAMATTFKTAIEHLGTSARRVAAALVAGIWRRKTLAEVEERVAALRPVEQFLLVGGVLATIFLLSLLAAQFGWIAMLALWLTVIVIVN